jgi:hypothetical protein
MRLIARVPEVHCIGCSSGGPEALAVIALVVGILALVVGILALATSVLSTKMARTEHQAFMLQLNARADFATSLVVRGQTVLWIDRWEPTDITVIFRLEIRNTGSKAAEHVDIRVLAPGRAAEMWWCTTEANPIGPDRRGVDTVERLASEEWGTQYLAHVEPRITLRAPVLLHFALTLPRDMNRLDTRVKVQCDDLPDDREQVVADYVAPTRDFRRREDGSTYLLRDFDPG